MTKATRPGLEWQALTFRTLLVGLVSLVAGIYLIVCCLIVRSDKGGVTSSADADGAYATRGGAAKAAHMSLSIRQELGRGAWNMLHRMAAGFPEKPSPAQRKDMASFFRLLGEFYPCDECAEHFRAMLAENPVDEATATNERLQVWLCERHNQVNARLKKEQFSCDIAKLKERWGDCGCGEKEGSASAAVPPTATTARAR